MTAEGSSGCTPVRLGREAVLETENAHLRAALALAGIDTDRLLAKVRGAADAAAGHVREMEAGRADLAEAEVLNEKLHRANIALEAGLAALAASEARLRSVFAMSTVGVLFWGPGFGLTEVNDAFLAMTGFSREEVVGKTWQELTPEEFHPASLRAVAEVTTQGETIPYEKQYFRKNGSRWWGLFAARKVGDVVIEFVLDVTARREVQEALRESEARFRHMADSAPALIWMTDADGRIVFANMHYDHMFGRPAAEMLGDGWASVVLEEDREAFDAVFRDAFRVRQPFRAETRVRDRAGQVVWLRCEGVPRLDDAGRFLGYTGCNVDITEARLAAEELERRVAARTAELMAAEETLRQAQKMEALGQLTGGIAHDFNNMLQGVVGGLDMARRRIGAGRAEEAGRYLDASREAVGRAAGLTRRLLAFARRQRLEPKPFDVDGLVAGLADLIRRTMGPGIGLELKLRDGTGSVLCDANELESALLNLCINARDAMPEGGRLTISTEDARLSVVDIPDGETAQDRYVAISVADTGAGIPPEVLGRVFDPFFTTKPVGEGTGLGLSQVYGFVRQSGGLVRIESTPGQGTTVRLLLPLHERATAAGEVDTPQPPRAVSGKTVLLVDDEDTVRHPAAERLRDLGYTVLEVRDGPEALQVLAAAHPDLLITDIGLPNGMNGRQVAEAVRERMPGLPVLFITGYAGISLPPGIEVIDKPFNLDMLARRVQAILETGQQANTKDQSA
jgi:PAS domain S-box-containing protein